MLRSISLRCVAVAAVTALPPANLRAEDFTITKGKAVIQSCIRLVEKNASEHNVRTRNEPALKAGPEARLAAARDSALANPESCIGVVANACVDASNDLSPVGQRRCYEVEAQIWDERLNGAYQKVLTETETILKHGGRAKDVPKVIGGYRNIQRAWIAYRDVVCQQPGLYFDGGADAAMMSVRCMMELTGRQAAWMQSRVTATPDDGRIAPK